LTERPKLLLIRPAAGAEAVNNWQMNADPPTIGRVKVSTKAAMAIEDIAAAVQRVESVLKRRPATGIHDDAPATARWQTGLRVVASHANGTQLLTDMPAELGGSGDLVTPGWLFRAGLASCFATRIAMGAAALGIELTLLEVLASSRSDTRGVFGMADASGEPVGAGPRDVQLLVKIAAPGVSADRLQSLVEDSNQCSPVSAAVRDAVSVALRIEVGAA
jgi:uncharacterized OsmC-like protein